MCVGGVCVMHLGCECALGSVCGVCVGVSVSVWVCVYGVWVCVCVWGVCVGCVGVCVVCVMCV